MTTTVHKIVLGIKIIIAIGTKIIMIPQIAIGIKIITLIAIEIKAAIIIQIAIGTKTLIHKTVTPIPIHKILIATKIHKTLTGTRTQHVIMIIIPIIEMAIMPTEIF